MTREELKKHCEKEIEMCEFWAIGKGEKPSGKIYEEHKLVLELLEQKPCEVEAAKLQQAYNEGFEDCRQAVRDTIFIECSSIKLDIDFAKVLLLQRAIKALPSVTPQESKAESH